MNFKEIFDHLVMGARVRRQWWAPGYYIYMEHSTLMNSRGHMYEAGGCDLLAEDWEVVPQMVPLTMDILNAALGRTSFRYMTIKETRSYAELLYQELGGKP